MTKQEAAQAIKDLLLDKVEVEVNIDESDLDAGMSIDTFERMVDVDRAINEQCEIIYYSRAMEFLQEHDPSLHEAMDCAEEYGYSPKDLSSELLATLLNERMMRNAYWEHRDEIIDILDEIEDEETDDIEGVGLISHLAPNYDSRKSFYGKAVIDDHNGSGIQTLYSYDTAVADYDQTTGVLTVYGWYSATTARHIREFAAQLGIDLPAGKNIKGEYRA